MNKEMAEVDRVWLCRCRYGEGDYKIFVGPQPKHKEIGIVPGTENGDVDWECLDGYCIARMPPDFWHAACDAMTRNELRLEPGEGPIILDISQNLINVKREYERHD